MPDPSHPFLLVLGTVQDGGSPHIGCQRDCCAGLWDNPDPDRQVVSLGLVDPEHGAAWMMEATPDFTTQLQKLMAIAKSDARTPDGIFLTHAHIGHYTGLMYLGREALGRDRVPVWAMPRMGDFLRANGPWSQLVDLGNIKLNGLSADSAIAISGSIRVTPFLVPHRDEFSETAGYRIEGPSRSALFIPDIDKWEKWDRDLREEIAGVDYAFIDGSFYANGELPGRDMSEIPHPFVEETMALLADLPAQEKGKVFFIHFNHTNPMLNASSEASRNVEKAGFRIARWGDKLPL